MKQLGNFKKAKKAPAQPQYVEEHEPAHGHPKFSPKVQFNGALYLVKFRGMALPVKKKLDHQTCQGQWRMPRRTIDTATDE